MRTFSRQGKWLVCLEALDWIGNFNGMDGELLCIYKVKKTQNMRGG
jgi:hypothetical protein